MSAIRRAIGVTEGDAPESKRFPGFDGREAAAFAPPQGVGQELRLRRVGDKIVRPFAKLRVA
jgi:hypothetical protein